MAETSLTKEEIDTLTEHVDTWSHKTRTERDNIKETLITQFLQGRQHNTKDVYARGFLKVVSIRIL